MNTPQQVEYFPAGDSAALRRRTLMSRAEFSAAVRNGMLKQVESHPVKGCGYPSAVLNRLSAESQARIVKCSATPVAAAALTLARRDGRDVANDQDGAAARLWCSATPAQRVTLASGFRTLNGGTVGMRMASNGKASFYKLP